MTLDSGPIRPKVTITNLLCDGLFIHLNFGPREFEVGHEVEEFLRGRFVKKSRILSRQASARKPRESKK